MIDTATHWNSITQITPALLGFTFATFICLGLVYHKQIKKIVRKSTYFIASIGFISSGFLVQIIYSNLDLLKNFAEEYKNIFSLPIFTIFATTIGIFLGNTLLRLRVENKDRRETAILLINTIDSHIKCMSMMNSYLSQFDQQIARSTNMNNKDEAIQLKCIIKIYLSQLSQDSYFETAFKK